MSDALLLRCGAYSAAISPRGAELQRLAWEGHELLWEGDPAWWPRRAPVLFPVVGSSVGGQLRLGGHTTPMPKHGFARDREWTVLESSERHCSLRLGDDAQTRIHYPFPFELSLAFSLDAAGLRMEAHLHNPGAEPLPAQFGFHPAFRWPLFPGQSREAHVLCFDHPEPDAMRALAGDLLAPGARSTPVVGDQLQLCDGLFAEDALVWEHPASRGLRYGIPGEAQLRVTWQTPSFACWTKPGAPFLCLEPWQGLCDAAGFQGDFRERIGVVQVAPGEAQSWSMSISMEGVEGVAARS